ncbi:autoinducer binding domain-containing protein [Bradyrhizobium sp. U87765 SZCCT0131]|uniref:helix-turn-helix transcriptional regulator n=1 Tax=unclassified Bradyrhizobium TaxID=2631580 RepID=UPI001BA95DC2|nr:MULTISPECIES: LuxR family transcriptional regulator [unclassified Bradyrhizobium]MBR1217852.1 autoinducer binding domain-containing protein [Bradyrhizobium sp. U87765 SZCCT0131]MBR1347281.1 autoinducer binding domain-containing protein [Bradyrhizobium sp. U87765 SZCCT0048]
MLDYGREAFDFIDRITLVPDPERIVDELRIAISSFGYTTVIVTGLPNLTERFEQKILHKHWPDEWFAIYARERYILDDPVAWLCRSTIEPFEWADARYDSERHPRSRHIMNAAKSFGMSAGFCVPIHGLFGLEWCVSMGGDKVDTAQFAKASVHLMSVYAFNKLRHTRSEIVAQRRRLTAREREVMAWTAAGKSAWETSCILGIGVDTVNKHVGSASRKLRAINKTQAVAEAIRLHEIPW